MQPLTRHAHAASGSVDAKLADGGARPPRYAGQAGGCGWRI